MNDVISSILEAEKKADEMIQKAQADAKALKISSDKKSEEIKETAINDFKSLRAVELDKAEKEALEKYQEIIKLGEKKADELVENAKVNLLKVADKIVEGFIK